MKKTIIMIIAALSVGVSLSFLLPAKESREAFFEANLEALAEYELCPGEAENCEDGGDHCYYSYNHRNYNIETKKNRR